MEALREIVFSVMVVSVSAAAVTALVPDNSKIVGYVRFLVGMIVTTVLLMPLAPLVKSIPDLDLNDIMVAGITSEDTYIDTVITDTCTRIETELTDMINQKFNMTPEYIRVECNNDIEALRVIKAVVCCKDANRLLCSDITNYLEGILGDECEVSIVNEDT
ncbi:MAG: hypothetical protein IKT46_05805 [Clostridia bacterium]|nr:hypothetical protein [Clostridia bacterium]